MESYSFKTSLLHLHTNLPIKLLDDAKNVVGQIFEGLGDERFGYLVVGFGYATADGGLGIGVATGCHGNADGVFKVMTLHETADGVWHGFLTGAVEMVFATYFIDVEKRRNGVVEIAFHGTPDFIFRDATGAQPVDECGHTLGTVDAFGMVVAHDGRLPGFVEHLVIVVEEPSYGAHPHGRTVATAARGLWVVALDPRQKSFAVTSHGVGIASTPVVQRILVRPMIHDGVGNGHRTNRIIGVTTFIRKQSEIPVGLLCKFKTRSNNIAYNRSYHVFEV